MLFVLFFFERVCIVFVMKRHATSNPYCTDSSQAHNDRRRCFCNKIKRAAFMVHVWWNYRKTYLKNMNCHITQNKGSPARGAVTDRWLRGLSCGTNSHTGGQWPPLHWLEHILYIQINIYQIAIVLYKYIPNQRNCQQNICLLKYIFEVDYVD